VIKQKQPMPVDVAVGRMLRALRNERGMSQGALANAVGLTFQQIQKYEKGTNRIGASRLMQFAEALNVNVARFFEGLDGQRETPESPSLLELATNKPGAFRLMQAYTAIENVDVGMAIVRLVEAYAYNTPEAT
jgi:transcriptional regulator with XRE-family HTH domain